MTASTLKKGDIVNFDMVRPGIFGDQYRNMTISAVGDYNLARNIDPEINAKHASFYPFFKDTVDNVNSPSIYDYLILQTSKTDPTLVVIGVPWINQTTLKTITSRYATIVINGFQEYHRSPVTDFLNNLNVSYTLEIKDNV